MKRRIIAILLVLMMAVTLLPISALAGETDTVVIRLGGDEVVDKDGYLVPGYRMSEIARGGWYDIESKEWFRNGESVGESAGTVAPQSVYTVDVVFKANTKIGRFTANPQFKIDKCIELLSYEVLDNGARARVKVQLKSQPAVESFSFTVNAGTMNEDGQLVHGSKFPMFNSDWNIGYVKVDLWKRDGEYVSSTSDVVAGHEYEVTLTLKHADHTSFDLNTNVIAPKGFKEQWRISDDMWSLRICYTVSSEPTRVIAENQIFGLKYADYTDDDGVIISGIGLSNLYVENFSYTTLDVPYWLRDVEQFVDGEKASKLKTLEAGQEYMTKFRIVPHSGYEFAEGVTIECDFARSVETSIDENGCMNVTIVARPATSTPVAKYMDIISPNLRSGTAAPKCTVNSHFEIKGAEWYCVDDAAAVPEGAVLQAGKVYSLRLYLTTTGNYIFKNFDNAGTTSDRTAPELFVNFNGKPTDSFYGVKNGEYAGCVCVEYTYPIVAMAAPTIKTNTTDVSALEGDDVSFTVECEGDYLSYQWYSLKDGVKTALEGENSPVLTIKNATVSQHNGISYYCVIRNGAGTVTSSNALLTVKLIPFTDVNEDAVYFGAVAWAYRHTPYQITGGFTATQFCPQNPSTRAQVVTFLWRAAGCPEPKSNINPFADVSDKQANGKDNPYYTAILWAAGEGITNGTDATHFSPNAEVTRAQFVTFLWRYEGKPDTNGSVDIFADAGMIASPYRTAVAWAVEKDIAAGYENGTFRPNNTCTRWAVVLFMYRDLA